MNTANTVVSYDLIYSPLVKGETTLGGIFISESTESKGNSWWWPGLLFFSFDWFLPFCVSSSLSLLMSSQLSVSKEFCWLLNVLNKESPFVCLWILLGYQLLSPSNGTWECNYELYLLLDTLQVCARQASNSEGMYPYFSTSSIVVWYDWTCFQGVRCMVRTDNYAMNSPICHSSSNQSGVLLHESCFEESLEKVKKKYVFKGWGVVFIDFASWRYEILMKSDDVVWWTSDVEDATSQLNL